MNKNTLINVLKSDGITSDLTRLKKKELLKLINERGLEVKQFPIMKEEPKFVQVSKIVHEGANIKRIYHLSDINFRNYEREKEYIEVIKQMLKIISEDKEPNKICVITGNIVYNARNLEPRCIKFVFQTIKYLSKLLPIIMIAGTNELSKTMDLLSVIETMFDNVIYLDKSGNYVYNNLNINAFCLNDGGITKMSPVVMNDKINVALHYGSHNYDFSAFKYVLLGGSSQLNIINGSIGYSGSLLQHYYSPTIQTHGMLIWDLENDKVVPRYVANNHVHLSLNLDYRTEITIDEFNPDKVYNIKTYEVNTKNEFNIGPILDNFPNIDTLLRNRVILDDKFVNDAIVYKMVHVSAKNSFGIISAQSGFPEGINIINEKNGAGKSSFVNSIEFALLCKTAGAIYVNNVNCRDKYLIQLSFENGDIVRNGGNNFKLQTTLPDFKLLLTYDEIIRMTSFCSDDYPSLEKLTRSAQKDVLVQLFGKEHKQQARNIYSFAKDFEGTYDPNKKMANIPLNEKEEVLQKLIVETRTKNDILGEIYQNKSKLEKIVLPQIPEPIEPTGEYVEMSFPKSFEFIKYNGKLRSEDALLAIQNTSLSSVKTKLDAVFAMEDLICDYVLAKKYGNYKNKMHLQYEKERELYKSAKEQKELLEKKNIELHIELNGVEINQRNKDELQRIKKENDELRVLRNNYLAYNKMKYLESKKEDCDKDLKLQQFLISVNNFYEEIGLNLRIKVPGYIQFVRNELDFDYKQLSKSEKIYASLGIKYGLHICSSIKLDILFIDEMFDSISNFEKINKTLALLNRTFAKIVVISHHDLILGNKLHIFDK